MDPHPFCLRRVWQRKRFSAWRLAVFASPQAGWDALFALFRGPTYSRLTLDETSRPTLDEALPSRHPPPPGLGPGQAGPADPPLFASSAVPSLRHPPIPPFVIRRLDRRIHFPPSSSADLIGGSSGQRGEHPALGIVLQGSWIRRINRRMTREGSSRIGSPVKPANDDSVISDQSSVISRRSSVIRTRGGGRYGWERRPSHAFSSPITDH